MEVHRILLMVFLASVTIKATHSKLIHQIKGNHTIVALVNFYGTVPNHTKCSQVRPVDGLLPCYALIKAVTNINKIPEISSRFKLGLIIYDVCDEQMLRNTILTIIWQPTTTAVIGPTSPDDVSIVGVSMNLYIKPVINFNTVPLDIDYRPHFDNMYWIAPKIKYLATSMVDFISHMHWNFIGLIHQNNKYGWEASDELKRQAEERSICFSSVLQVKAGISAEEINSQLTKVASDKRVSVVVLILEETELINLLQSLKQKPEILTKNLQFLSLSKWGTKQLVVRGNEKYAHGVITFQPLYNMDSDFNEYYYTKDFSARNGVVSYTMKTQNKTCEGDRKCLYKAFGNITHSNAAAYSDSVYRLAAAFYNAHLLNESHHLSKSDGRKKILVKTLLAQREMTKLPPFQKKLLKFQQNRRIEPSIGIYNYQKNSDSCYGYKQIGQWSLTNGNQSVFRVDNVNTIQWQFGRFVEPPVSTCSRQCAANEIRITVQQYATCCWDCIPCDDHHQYSRNNTCVQCAKDERPNQALLRCDKLPQSTGDIPYTLLMIIYTYTGLTFVLTATAFTAFVHYRETRVIRASSRELSSFIFFGLLLWDCVPIFMTSEVTKLTCVIRNLFLYLGYSMVYAPLLLKTNRVYRIFRLGKLCTKPPKAVSPLSQVLITACFCAIQIMICLARLTDVTLKEIYPATESVVILCCTDDLITFIVNLVYVLSIMCATTFYAFKTRHFPKNYNESKYIGIAMYITCFISTVGLVTYIAVDDNGMKSIIMSGVCLFCSNTVLVCIFAKKFHILLKRDKRKKSESNPRNIEERFHTDCTSIDTNITITTTETTTNNNNLKVADIQQGTESPNLWDTRRFSNNSMLSMLRVHDTKKTDI